MAQVTQRTPEGLLIADSLQIEGITGRQVRQFAASGLLVMSFVAAACGSGAPAGAAQGEEGHGPYSRNFPVTPTSIALEAAVNATSSPTATDEPRRIVTLAPGQTPELLLPDTGEGKTELPTQPPVTPDAPSAAATPTYTPDATATRRIAAATKKPPTPDILHSEQKSGWVAKGVEKDLGLVGPIDDIAKKLVPGAHGSAILGRFSYKKKVPLAVEVLENDRVTTVTRDVWVGYFDVGRGNVVPIILEQDGGMVFRSELDKAVVPGFGGNSGNENGGLVPVGENDGLFNKGEAYAIFLLYNVPPNAALYETQKCFTNASCAPLLEYRKFHEGNRKIVGNLSNKKINKQVLPIGVMRQFYSVKK